MEKPDRILLHPPERCTVCGQPFTEEDPQEGMSRRPVLDLPQPKLEITKHRLGCMECCGQKQYREYPADVRASVQYGPGVRALVVQLSVDHKMPLEQIGTLFGDLYGYELNSETVEQALEEGYELAAPLEVEIKEQLKNADLAFYDETGLRVGGKLEWLPTGGNSWYTHWFVHPRRGEEALRSEDSVLKDFTGWAIHDFTPAYYQFTQAKHGACNAHVLRELQGLAENGSGGAKAMQAFRLELHGRARPLQGEEAMEARQRYHQILSQAEREEPSPEPKRGKGRPQNTPGRNLLRRLREHEEAVLAFARVEGVPFTHNQAERDLRPAKVKQRVSGGFRTEHGAKGYARWQAVISTCRQQERNIFETLRALFAHQPVSLIVEGR